MRFGEFLKESAKKWQREWERARVAEADPKDVPKFYLTAAFPYPNSPMHIGHSRTYTIADVYARYMKMKGYNVLYPMGFHYTGTPIIAMSEKVKQAKEALKKFNLTYEDLKSMWEEAKKRGKELGSSIKEVIRERGLSEYEDALEQLLYFLFLFELPMEDVLKLDDPLAMANYFAKITEESMKRLGYMIDWRRKFTTVDEHFKQFIRWQYLKLKEMGYISKGTHPVAWDPVYQTPVSQHDTKGDVEPEIGEFTLILFEGKVKGKEVYFPAATLRPETVFGVTNVWLNPEAKYKIVKIGDKRYLLSEKAAFKIKFQKDEVTEEEVVKGEELLGLRVRNPATGKEVPILPASFVNPNLGTGVVMSVPAHAPYDYVALRDLIEKGELGKYGVSEEEVKPIVIIKVPGLKVPAKEIVEKMGIKSQEEKEKLDLATKEVYRLEHTKGKMIEDIDKTLLYNDPLLKAAIRALIGNKDVPTARENTKEWLNNMGRGDVFYDITNGPVISRFGNEVVVKILKDQWFLDYDKEEWKELARKCLDRMRIVPEKERKSFEWTISWLKKRACARTRGLGTPLPWDPNWVIESLSDSTIYMAFYTVAPHVKKVDAEKLKPEVWDYILLGKGKAEEVAKKYGIDVEILKKAREEFEYWYPLDSRHSGRDLVPNHLTFFIFHHAAIFPEEKWPRQIVVNGFVTLEGKKMSKSLGNIVPAYKAVDKYSPDVVRLGVLATAELDSDADFSDAVAQSILTKLENFYKIAKAVKDSGEPKLKEHLDRWFLTKFYKMLNDVTNAMENFKYREAVTNLIYNFSYLIDSYYMKLKETGREFDEEAKATIRKALTSWVKALTPFAPHFAEEVYHLLGGEGLVVEQRWPEVVEELMDTFAEAVEEYYERLVSDIEDIIKVAKIKPEVIKIYLADERDREVLKKAIKFYEEGKGLKEFMREVMSEVRDKRYANKARKIFDLASQVRDLKEIIDREEEALNVIKERLERRFNAKVEISKEPPKGKIPLPLKPALVIEGRE